jgi:uncharacterized protein
MTKNILVVGGTDGLGKALVEQYVGGGDNIFVIGTSSDKLSAMTSPQVTGALCDIASLSSCQEVLGEVQAKFDHIDIMINSAGVLNGSSFVDLDPAEIARVLNVNTLGNIQITKTMLPLLKSGSQLVNIISQDGLIAKQDRSIYCASKWGMVGFGKVISQELAPMGIKVISVNPGLMATDFFKRHSVDRDLSVALNPVEVANFVYQITQLPASIQVSEVSLVPFATEAPPVADSPPATDNLTPAVTPETTPETETTISLTADITPVDGTSADSVPTDNTPVDDTQAVNTPADSPVKPVETVTPAPATPPLDITPSDASAESASTAVPAETLPPIQYSGVTANTPIDISAPTPNTSTPQTDTNLTPPASSPYAVEPAEPTEAPPVALDNPPVETATDSSTHPLFEDPDQVKTIS